MDLKDAKWDVRRFGSSGLSKTDHVQDKIELLVKLGAKVKFSRVKSSVRVYW